MYVSFPDNKVHGANMGPIWGRQDPGGPHVGPMNFAIWVDMVERDFFIDSVPLFMLYTLPKFCLLFSSQINLLFNSFLY